MVIYSGRAVSQVLRKAPPGMNIEGILGKLQTEGMTKDHLGRTLEVAHCVAWLTKRHLSDQGWTRSRA